MLSNKYLELFKFTNYKFSTKRDGQASSLYFQDIQGNQGRWRREHRDGELLVYQGKSLRLFINPLGMDGFDPDESLTIWKDKRDRIGNHPHYSAAPCEGWHVVELVPPNFLMGHGSGGGVLLRDQTAGAAGFDLLGDYSNDQVSDWTVV